MITTIGTNVTPTNFEGASHKEDVTVIKRQVPSVGVTVDLCDVQCPYVEPKFAELGANNLDYKNDKTENIFPLSVITDSVTIKLFKCENGAQVEKAILNDNLYGTFFPNTFFPDQLKIGFLADWNLILNAFGTGRYLFKTERTLLSVVDTVTSWFYDLKVFDEIDADNTVRIDSTQTGIIENGVNYSGFTWEKQIRFVASFGRPEPEITQDHIQTQDRVDTQVRDSERETYILEVELAPFEVMTPFKQDTLLANDHNIISYMIKGYLPRYVKFNVMPTEDIGGEFHINNTNGTFEVKFRDKVLTPVKTNFL